MKKIVLTTVLTIALMAVLSALALPWWFGMQAEKSYSAMIDQFARGSGLQFTGRNYHRGWLNSTAETVIRLPEAKFEIVASHQISHGPLPLDRIRQGDWKPAQAHIASQLRFNATGQDHNAAWPPLNAEITFHLRGDGSVRAEMPAVRKSGEQGQILDWRGLSMNMSFDREWKQFRFDAQMPGLVLSAPGEGEFSLSRISLNSDMHEGTAGYFFSDAALTVGKMEFGGAAGHLALQGLEVSTSAKPGGENVNMIIRYRVGEARTAEDRYGPGQLVLELRHLDAAALVKFKNEVDGIYRGNLPPPQAAMMVAGKGLELIGALSKKAPELEVTQLSLKTRAGEISGKAKFVLDGRKADLGQNPMLLLTSIAGDVELSLPPAVVSQLLAPQIRRDIEAYRENSLSAQDMARLDAETMEKIVERAVPQYLARNEFTRHLVEDNGRYKLILSLRHGQMQLNGKPWHLPTRASRSL